METWLLHIPFWALGFLCFLNIAIIAIHGSDDKTVFDLRITYIAGAIFLVYLGVNGWASDNTRTKTRAFGALLLGIPMLVAIPFLNRKQLEVPDDAFEPDTISSEMFKDSSDISRFELKNDNKDH